MFLLEVLGPLTSAKLISTVNPDTGQQEEESTQTKLPSQGEDSFGKLKEKESPFSKKSSLPHTSVSEQRKEYLREQILGRLESDDLSDEQRSEIAGKLSSNPDVTKSSGNISLVRAGKLMSGALDKRVEAFLRELELTDRELAEIEKARAQQSREDQEIERVFIAMSFSASNPAGALSTLNNLLGSLKNPFAISLASSGIAQIAPFAVEEGKKQAREKGDTSLSQAVLSALRGGVINVCDDCHDGALTERGGDESPVINLTQNAGQPQIQEVYAVDDETGEVVGVFYDEVDPEECEARIGAQEVAENVTQDSSRVARSGLLDAQREAGKKTDEKEAQALAQNNLNRLQGQERSITEPNQKTANVTAQSTEKKTLGIA